MGLIDAALDGAPVFGAMGPFGDCQRYFRLLVSRPFTRVERLLLVRGSLAPLTALRWSGFVDRFYRRYAETSPKTRVLLKPLRNYVLRGLSPRRRADLMIRHHDLMARLFPAEIIAALCAYDTVGLVTLAGKVGRYRLCLCNPTEIGMPREGEIGLYFQDLSDGAILARMCVILDQVQGRRILVIGGLQGLAGAKAAIIRATRDLHGLRPKDAVLLAVRSLAAAAGLTEVHAIANHTHVAKHGESHKIVHDYDSYWLERGAIAAGPYGFTFPSAPEPVQGVKARDLTKRRILETVPLALGMAGTGIFRTMADRPCLAEAVAS